MSLIQFTSNTKLADNGNTTIGQIVRLFNGLISNLNAIFQQLLKQVQLDSVILPNIVLKVGDNVIPHSLNRTLTGWQVIRQNAASQFFDKQTTTTYDTSTYLILNSSVACTVSLLVF
jgi:hypothetical protein